MRNNKSPCLTFCPSVKPTDSSWPAIWDFTCTTADASTVPITRTSVGTDSWVALATDTDMAGGPAGGPPACACCFWQPQITTRQKAIGIRMVMRKRTPEFPLYQSDEGKNVNGPGGHLPGS